MQSDTNILQIDNLSKYFGGLAAVSNCSIKIKKGSITGVIGPNGSGKTTLFNLIAGNLKTSKGTVLFNNEDITDVPAYELFSKGLLRTFQIAHEFTNLTVLENLMMVPGGQSGENLVNALLKPVLVNKEEEISNELEGQKDILSKNTDSLNDLMGKLGDLESHLSSMDDMVDKISDLEDKIEKYRPRTPEEKMELRKHDSGPFANTLTDFFTDKEEVFDKTGKKQYILKKEDIENYDEIDIKDSFNATEEE